MQDMADRRSSNQPASLDVQPRPDESDSGPLLTEQVRSPPTPILISAIPTTHNTNWFRKASAKLKIKRKGDDASADILKVAGVETPGFDESDVEYFRACVHHFKWTMPRPKQLRKVFTTQFTRALTRNATAQNRSGQCFLAFVLHEAKKFFKENDISTRVHYNGRMEVYELGRFLSTVLHRDVADLIAQTIGAQTLHVGGDLARTQCLHDRFCPDWLRLIAERVLLNPYMRTPSRESLSVFLGMLELHSCLRLSDEARRSLASGPWSKKYMKIAHKTARRRQANRKVTRQTLPNPLAAHSPSMSASRARHSPGLLEFRGDDNEDESTTVYNADVSRQHMESAQSPEQPTRPIQVFRNGAPHSLYTTEAYLVEEIRVLERRLEARRAYLQLPNGELPSAAPRTFASPASPKAATCILHRVQAQLRLGSRCLCCKRRQKQATPGPQTQSQPPADSQSRPQKSTIRRHRGPREKQKAALEQLQVNILALQARSSLLMEEIEFLRENLPRPAAVAVPSRRAAFNQGKKEQARFQDQLSRSPSKRAVFNQWKKEQARFQNQLSRSSSQQATTSSQQARSSAEHARSSNEQAQSSATQATSLDGQATVPDQTIASASQSAASSTSLFGPFVNGVGPHVEPRRQSQQQDNELTTPNQDQSQAPSSSANPDPGPVPIMRGGASGEESQSQVPSPAPANQGQTQATLAPGANRFTGLRRCPPRNPSQDRANVYREQEQSQDQPQSQAASRGREKAQQQDQAAPRVPSDSPPTYAQSERTSQRQGDRASQKKRNGFGQKVKRMLKKMGIKRKEKSGRKDDNEDHEGGPISVR